MKRLDARTNYMGGCQNYGPVLGTLNIRGRIIIGIPKRAHNLDNHPYRHSTEPVPKNQGNTAARRLHAVLSFPNSVSLSPTAAPQASEDAGDATQDSLSCRVVSPTSAAAFCASELVDIQHYATETTVKKVCFRLLV